MKKLIAMALTIATLLTPSNVYAKETVKIEPPHDKSQVVTYDEVFSKISLVDDSTYMREAYYYKNNGHDFSDGPDDPDNHGDMRQYFESLNGCYDDKGLKIYTVFDGKTKKFKKTGTWSIIVGSNKKKLDYGCVKFTAPKDGYYKFTIDVRKNVLRGPVNYSIEWNHVSKKYKVKSPKLYGVADKVADRGCEMYYGTYDCPASPRKESFYTNMKKGQSVEYEAGSTYNSYVNNYNYKREYYADCYVGFDFTVERVSGWKK